MKTNISNLINLVAEDERKLNVLSRGIVNHVYTVTAKELDGKENIIEDYKEDFESEYAQYNEVLERIEKMKKVIYLKNNELRLPDGSSIQDALVKVGILRKKFNLLNQLCEYKSSNHRITEVNNSYFECKTLNFDTKELKSKLDEIEKKIQNIEFEISKLNSIEFDIEI